MEKLNEYSMYLNGLLVETVPFITLAAIISFLFVFIPVSSIRRLFLRGRMLPVFIAAGLGFFVPLCECSIIPIAAGFIRRGVPIPVALTFLVAAPSLSPLVVAVTSVAYARSPDMIYIRFASGFFLAIATGIVFYMLEKRGVFEDDKMPGEAASCCGADVGPSATSEEKIRAGFDDAVSDFTRTLGFIIIAAVITAAVKVFVSSGLLNAIGQNPATGAPAMMLFSFVLSTCSDSDAFIPAAMSAFSKLSQMGFLLLGPVIDFKLVLMHFAFLPRRVSLVLLAVYPLLVTAVISILCLVM